MNIDKLTKSLGICIGASTVSFVECQKKVSSIEIVSYKSINHEGNPKEVLNNFFKSYDVKDCSVIATGRKFKQLLNTVSIPEPQAIEESLEFLQLAGKYDTCLLYTSD
ncbi:MAG: hypothetical protein N3A61_08190, partial [Ignavibacteria bacterium]|nr:hypothetical protein [Ignavibacteria bacterium]